MSLSLPPFCTGPMGRMRDKSAHTTGGTSRLRSIVEKGGGGTGRGEHITKSNAIARQASICFTSCRQARQEGKGRAGCDDFHTRINQSNGSSRNGNRDREGGEEGGEVQPDCHKVKFYDCQRIITHSLSLPISGTSSLSLPLSHSQFVFLPLSLSSSPSLCLSPSPLLYSLTPPHARLACGQNGNVVFCCHLDATDAGVKCLTTYTHTHSHTLTYDTHTYAHTCRAAIWRTIWRCLVCCGCCRSHYQMTLLLWAAA